MLGREEGLFITFLMVIPMFVDMRSPLVFIYELAQQKQAIGPKLLTNIMLLCDGFNMLARTFTDLTLI